MKADIKTRFKQFVPITGPDECWIWTGAKSPQGYGQIRHNGRACNAHRVSWELANDKQIPAGMFACHSCDCRLCVNPSHIFIGTPKDNIADMMQKGRHGKMPATYRGERTGQAKFTDDQVRQIKRELANGYRNQSAIARRFGVHTSTIGKIASGRNWAWL